MRHSNQTDISLWIDFDWTQLLEHTHDIYVIIFKKRNNGIKLYLITSLEIFLPIASFLKRLRAAVNIIKPGYKLVR